MRHAVELPTKDRESDDRTIAAEIAPDNTLGERDRANTTARSGETASRLPTLQFLTAYASSDGRLGAALPVTVSVRNTSTVATSPATEFQLEGYQSCGTRNWGGGPNRVAVPALAPLLAAWAFEHLTAHPGRAAATLRDRGDAEVAPSGEPRAAE